MPPVRVHVFVPTNVFRQPANILLRRVLLVDVAMTYDRELID